MELLNGHISGITVRDGWIYLNYPSSPLFIVDGMECIQRQAEMRVDIPSIVSVEVRREGHMWGLKDNGGLIVINTRK